MKVRSGAAFQRRTTCPGAGYFDPGFPSFFEFQKQPLNPPALIMQRRSTEIIFSRAGMKARIGLLGTSQENPRFAGFYQVSILIETLIIMDSAFNIATDIHDCGFFPTVQHTILRKNRKGNRHLRFTVPASCFWIPKAMGEEEDPLNITPGCVRFAFMFPVRISPARCDLLPWFASCGE